MTSFINRKYITYRNAAEEDRDTDTGNMHENSGEDWMCDSGDMLADRQIFTLITILRLRINK